MGVLLLLVVATTLLYGQAWLGGVAPAVPDIGPVLMVYAGLFVRRESVPTVAAGVGVLRSALDLETVGVSILAHLAVAMLVRAGRDVLYAERVATQLVVTFAAGAVFVGLRSLHAGLVAGDPVPSATFQWTVSACLGTLVAPPLFLVLKFSRIGPLERP